MKSQVKMLKQKLYTLVFVRRGQQILLGLKKRGFGEGRWNGFGGKVQSDETVEEAAKRELWEECSVQSHNLEHSGILEFEFVGNPVIMCVHVFQTHDYDGVPQESEEMQPQWYNVDKVPFASMWPDDPLWFPLMLNGSKFRGYFKFQGMSTILEYKLNKVDKL